MNTGKTLFAQVMEFLPWKTSAGLLRATAATAGFGRSVAASNTEPWRWPN